jgi:hypothetical protein
MAFENAYLVQQIPRHVPAVYGAIHDLNMLSLRICPSVAHPYVLVIDKITVETIAFFAPEAAELALAFGALACPEPVIDGLHFVDLGYVPLRCTEFQRPISSDTKSHSVNPEGTHSTV